MSSKRHKWRIGVKDDVLGNNKAFWCLKWRFWYGGTNYLNEKLGSRPENVIFAFESVI